MLKSLCLWLGLCSVQALHGPAYVIDGDTIVVLGAHIRLQGIDAPELSEPGGQAAKGALQQILANTTPTCTFTGQHSYGREVGTCTVNGIDVGQLMVKGGYALDCPYYSNWRYKQWELVNIHQKLTSKPYCNMR